MHAAGGGDVGLIKSAWEYDGKLDIVVEINSGNALGRVAGAFVSSRCLKDFSLGYSVQVLASGGGDWADASSV
mgnify:CR=1 FL=1